MQQKKSVSSVTIIPALLFMALLVALPGQANAAEDYLSTGLGKTKREIHPEYPLKLEFSLRTGPYVADVDVDIFQDGRKVKSIHSPGPWLYVDLEPGSYAVTATLEDGRKQGAQFTITEDKQQQVILSWPKE